MPLVRWLKTAENYFVTILEARKAESQASAGPRLSSRGMSLPASAALVAASVPALPVCPARLS